MPSPDAVPPALFRALLDDVDEALLVLEPVTGRILDANERALSITGLRRADILRRRFADVTGPLDAALFDAETRAAFPGTLRRADASGMPVEWRLRHVAAGAGYIVAFARDLSEGDETMRARMRLAAEPRPLLAALDEAVLRVDRASDGSYAVTVEGGRLLPVVRGGAEPGRVPEALRAPVIAAFAGETRTFAEERDGRHLRFRAEPIRGDAGEVEAVAVLVADVSHEVSWADLRAGLEHEARQKDHALELASAELRTLGHAIGHDVASQLAQIDVTIRALAENPRLDPAARRHVERIRAASSRMGEQMDEILKLGRVRDADLARTRVDLGQMARDVARELAESEPARKVEVTIADRLVAEGDARLLGIAVDNLLRTAWRSTGDRPEAKIEFGAVDRRGTTAYFVRENGLAIEAGDVKRLVSAFERLHAASPTDGAELPLATVSRIVGRHGGTVWTENEAGAGATLWFTLPA